MTSWLGECVSEVQSKEPRSGRLLFFRVRECRFWWQSQVTLGRFRASDEWLALASFASALTARFSSLFWEE